MSRLNMHAQLSLPLHVRQLANSNSMNFIGQRICDSVARALCAQLEEKTSSHAGQVIAMRVQHDLMVEGSRDSRYA